MNRRAMLVTAAAVITTSRGAWAHHGWSSFDESKPIFLQGKVTRVKWQNPHAELELATTGQQMPNDLAERKIPAQQGPVDAAKILAAASAPTRTGATWTVELAPLTRLQAWKIGEIKAGSLVEVIG